MNEPAPLLPKVVRIEPASRCNLKCMHCPTGTVDIKRGLMNENVLERVLEELKKNKEHIKIVVLYHGGEPLLHKNFFEIIKRVKKINNDFFVKTVSNGMALKRENSEKLIDSQIDLIEFSLDGISSEESQHIRIKSNTDKIIENIKNLIEIKKLSKSNKPKIYINTTQFLENNIKDNEKKEIIDRVNNFFHDMKLNKKKISSEAPTPKWLIDIFGNSVDQIKCSYAIEWPHMGDVSSNFDIKKIDIPDRDYCDHIYSTVTIRSNGDIVPCCYDLTSKLKMGNILNNNLKEIFHNHMYKKLRSSIKKKRQISICKNCPVVKSPKYLIPKWRIEKNNY